jgi:hypothetical protein
MRAATRDELWARLSGASLVAGEMPARGERRAPWFVRLMLGFAGWMGALFLLGFVGAGLAFVVKSAAASFAVGALACAAAAVLFRAGRASDFVDQFGLAVSLAGQALMVYAIARWFDRSLAGVALVVAAQQAVLFALVPNFIHRVWTAWTGSYMLALAMADAGLHAFAPALVTAAFLYVWLREFDHARHGELLRAGGYGLALAAVQTAVMHGGLWISFILARGAREPLGGEAGVWLGASASGLVLLGAVLMLLRREGVATGSGPGGIALAAAAILALATLKAPGVGPAVAILVVGFANANRVLAGLGIGALLGYLSHYYYALDATLLEKSALMAITGVALLAARLALHRWWPPKGEVGHA